MIISTSEAQMTCPTCRTPDGSLMPFRDASMGVIHCRADAYHWRACRQCGSAYPSFTPSFEELQRYREANRVEDLPGDVATVWGSRLQASLYWAEETWASLSSHLGLKTGRWLDFRFGLCATGKKLQAQSWRAMRIDGDPNTQRIHRQLGVETVAHQFEGVRATGTFDLVSTAASPLSGLAMEGLMLAAGRRAERLLEIGAK